MRLVITAHRAVGRARDALGVGVWSAALLLWVCAATLVGQGTVALQGHVVSAETLSPLPYSTVALLPVFGARFTSDSGAFAFSHVRPGAYRLLVRQIGYVPLDSSIIVGEAPLALRVELRRLAFELPPVTVVARGICRNPGPPDPRTDPDLAIIFDQLRENAARFRLLADAYPFRYWNERIQSAEVTSDAPPVERVDTLELASHGRWRYAPGRLIVTAQRSPRERERVMNIPSLADLADTVFHRAHCFSFGGFEALGADDLLRVDFQAAARIRTPDVDGKALLDPETHQLRQLVLRLTRSDRAARGMTGLEVVVTFQELMPSVIVPAHVVATTTVRARGRSEPMRLYERQSLVRVEFLRSPPGRR